MVRQLLRPRHRGPHLLHSDILAGTDTSCGVLCIDASSWFDRLGYFAVRATRIQSVAAPGPEGVGCIAERETVV